MLWTPAHRITIGRAVVAVDDERADRLRLLAVYPLAVHGKPTRDRGAVHVRRQPPVRGLAGCMHRVIHVVGDFRYRYRMAGRATVGGVAGGIGHMAFVIRRIEVDPVPLLAQENPLPQEVESLLLLSRHAVGLPGADAKRLQRALA
jgi:hypothetical protein